MDGHYRFPPTVSIPERNIHLGGQDSSGGGIDDSSLVDEQEIQPFSFGFRVGASPHEILAYLVLCSGLAKYVDLLQTHFVVRRIVKIGCFNRRIRTRLLQEVKK